MAILIPSEASTYLPDLTLGAAQLRLALSQAEAIATGPSGSNRPLDLRQHQEQLNLNESGIAQLRHWPIDTTQTTTLELRDFAQRGDLGVSDWTISAADQFEIYRGEVRVKIAGAAFANLAAYGRQGTFRRARPMQQRTRIEARLTYWSGFDFRMTIPADWETMAAGPERDRIEEVVKIKSALAGIVGLRQAAADALAGVGSSTGDSTVGKATGRKIRVDSDREYVVAYGSGSDSARLSDSAQKTATSAMAAGSSMEELLAIFRQYQARLLPV